MIASADPVAAGALLTYTFTFANAGGRAMDITVTATTPPGTTFDSASGSPTSDPGVGGSGTVTWSYPELPMGGSSIVTMTVRVDAGLANGTPITITGYQVECSMPPGILPELGVDLTVTVQSIRPIIVTKKDYPDPVLTDDLLYYTATVTNLGPQSLTNVLLQEVYDPNLAFVSAIPPPDSGTVDRWTIPFLPFGGSREFVIQMKVRDATEAGSIQHNKVTAETAFGNVSNMFEDTVVTNEDELMTATLDDFPDPAEPDQAVQYDFTFGNGTERDLNNVIVRAWYSPELKFISADRPPDIIAPIAEWNIGTMLAGSSDQIFLTLAPVALFPKGTTAQVRFWVTDDSGATASANESTVFAEPSGPYVITIIGKPKNPSVSVDALEIYSIEIRNITPNPQNVTVTDFLPSSLKFIGASPPAILSPPGATSGGTVTLDDSQPAPRRHRSDRAAHVDPARFHPGHDAGEHGQRERPVGQRRREDLHRPPARPASERRTAAHRDDDGVAHHHPRRAAALHAQGEEQRRRYVQERRRETEHSGRRAAGTVHPGCRLGIERPTAMAARRPDQRGAEHDPRHLPRQRRRTRKHADERHGSVGRSGQLCL